MFVCEGKNNPANTLTSDIHFYIALFLNFTDLSNMSKVSKLSRMFVFYFMQYQVQTMLNDNTNVFYTVSDSKVNINTKSLANTGLMPDYSGQHQNVFRTGSLFTSNIDLKTKKPKLIFYSREDALKYVVCEDEYTANMLTPIIKIVLLDKEIICSDFKKEFVTVNDKILDEEKFFPDENNLDPDSDIKNIFKMLKAGTKYLSAEFTARLKTEYPRIVKQGDFGFNQASELNVYKVTNRLKILPIHCELIKPKPTINNNKSTISLAELVIPTIFDTFHASPANVLSPADQLIQSRKVHYLQKENSHKKAARIQSKGKFKMVSTSFSANESLCITNSISVKTLRERAKASNKNKIIQNFSLCHALTCHLQDKFVLSKITWQTLLEFLNGIRNNSTLKHLKTAPDYVIKAVFSYEVLVNNGLQCLIPLVPDNYLLSMQTLFLTILNQLSAVTEKQQHNNNISVTEELANSSYEHLINCLKSIILFRVNSSNLQKVDQSQILIVRDYMNYLLESKLITQLDKARVEEEIGIYTEHSSTDNKTIALQGNHDFK